MALSIHETKEQILANAYHLYPSHVYHKIILSTNGPLLPVRHYHAYVVAQVCANLHCNANQHCSATSSMLITGLDCDTIGGAYTNLLDATMYRCWQGHGQLHGDVQHISGHGVQENQGLATSSGPFGSGTAAASPGGNLGSAQRTASFSGFFGSGQTSTGSALAKSGQRPQSTVDPFPTINMSQGGQDHGKTKGVQGDVTEDSGIHNHNAENNHRPSTCGGRSGNNSHAIGEVKNPYPINGCERVDCKVCLYLKGDLSQDAQSWDTHDPRVRGQGISGHGPRNSPGFTFGTAASESMDSLKDSAGTTFGTATERINRLSPSPGLTFGTAAKKSTDGPKNSFRIMFDRVKTSTQDRFVAGQASTGSGGLRPNDASSENPGPLFQNISVSTGSRYLHNSVLDKRDAGDEAWRPGRRFISGTNGSAFAHT